MHTLALIAVGNLPRLLPWSWPSRWAAPARRWSWWLELRPLVEGALRESAGGWHSRHWCGVLLNEGHPESRGTPFPLDYKCKFVGLGFLAKSIGSTFQTNGCLEDNAPVRYLTDTIP